MKTIYDFSVKNTKNEDISLENYKGKIILIVNTATKCGLAPQFDGLENLWQKYGKENFVILGFPSNQFANQEPETNDTVEATCKLNFGVTFPLFAKIDVNGENESPLYTFLKNQNLEEKSNGGLKALFFKILSKVQGRNSNDIKWNFTKFLVNKNGQVIARYAPSFEPKDIEKEIEKLLAE